MNDVLNALIASQDGMVARRQLNRHGIGWDHVDAEVRHEPEQVAADLVALGVPGRVPDNAA